jgi:hypothetical protein
MVRWVIVISFAPPSGDQARIIAHWTRGIVGTAGGTPHGLTGNLHAPATSSVSNQ